MFEKLMALIEQICEGEKDFYDLLLFRGSGMIIDSRAVRELIPNECGFDDLYEEHVEYDFQNAKADEAFFTPEQCEEINEAWENAYWNVKDYEDSCASALIDWNS